MMMTAKDMVMMGLFVLAVVGFTAGYWAGFSRKLASLVSRFKDTTERLQREIVRLKLITCRSRGKCRRSYEDDINDLTVQIGLEAYKAELYASKPTLTLCEQCHSRTLCPDRNDTQETCVKFIAETPEQVIAENNIEAAESVKRLGAECVGNLTDMGFTDKEINEIYWHSSGGVLYAIHSNHKPVKISDGKVEFLGPDEMLPVDFWKKVQSAECEPDDLTKLANALEEGDTVPWSYPMMGDKHDEHTKECYVETPDKVYKFLVPNEYRFLVVADDGANGLCLAYGSTKACSAGKLYPVSVDGKKADVVPAGNPHHDSTKKACEESIGMTDEARKILEEGDDDPLT